MYTVTVTMPGVNSDAPIRIGGFVSRAAAEQYMVKFADWNSGKTFTYIVE